MAKKLTIQEMHDIAKGRGGKCLSRVYVNADTHLLWECSCGNVWTATPAKVKTGRWCPKCGVKRAWTKRERPSIDSAIEMAISKSMLFLSSSYETARTKYLWQCPNGHQFRAAYSNIKSGKGCPYCSRFVKEEQCRFIFSQLTEREFPRRRVDGYELDGYCPDLSLAFEYQGEQHYHNTRRWTKGKNGLQRQKERDYKKLLHCISLKIDLIMIPYFEAVSPAALEIYIKQRLNDCFITVAHEVNWDDFVGKSGDLRSLQNLCQSRKIKCLSTAYYNSCTKMYFLCEVCSHVWKTVPGSIKCGSGCSKCSDKRVSVKNTRYDKQIILKLRKQGMCYREISEQIGCAISTAHYVCTG